MFFRFTFSSVKQRKNLARSEYSDLIQLSCNEFVKQTRGVVYADWQFQWHAFKHLVWSCYSACGKQIWLSRVLIFREANIKKSLTSVSLKIIKIIILIWELLYCLFLFLFSGQRPFKCSYCPYSAKQKGNLKTHVLCVHRMPFDNSEYPDRRFKRPRPESDIAEKSSDESVGGVRTKTTMSGAGGSHGSNIVPFTEEATSCQHE